MEHHEAEQRHTKPFSYRSLLHLYKGSNTDILFQQYAKVFSNNQSKEILPKLRKSDLQDAPNGFEFMGSLSLDGAVFKPTITHGVCLYRSS